MRPSSGQVRAGSRAASGCPRGPGRWPARPAPARAGSPSSAVGQRRAAAACRGSSRRPCGWPASASPTWASTSSARRSRQPGGRGSRPAGGCGRCAPGGSARLEHRADRPQRLREVGVRRPPIVAVPRVGVTSPSSIRSVVVLPAPLGPRKPVTEPGSTVKLRSSTARTVPKDLVRPRTSTRTGRRAVGAVLPVEIGLSLRRVAVPARRPVHPSARGPTARRRRAVRHRRPALSPGDRPARTRAGAHTSPRHVRSSGGISESAYRTVVVGTDGSESSLRAVARAGALAGASGATLVVACAYLPTEADDRETRPRAGRAAATTPTRSSARTRPRTPCGRRRSGPPRPARRT